MNKKSFCNIVTNSLLMMRNFRAQLLEDIALNYEIRYLLSDDPDLFIHDLPSIIRFSRSAKSSSFLFFIKDIFYAGLLLRKNSGSWIVFTARNVLIFGLAGILVSKKLNVGYLAGLGRAISVERLVNSRIYRLFIKAALSSYSVLFVLNDRDYNLLKHHHNNVKLIYGEGFGFSSSPMLTDDNLFEYDYGFVGRFIKPKGADLFIDLVKREPTKRFVIYGAIDQAYESVVRELDNLTLKGFVDSKSHIYSSFRILLHFSTLNEGLPFVFFEAVDFRKPLVALMNSSTDTFLSLIGITAHPEASIRSQTIEDLAAIPFVTNDLKSLCSYELTNKHIVNWLDLGGY